MSAMLIRSKIKRPGGSNVVMADGRTIAFRPDTNGDHVALVSSVEHIQCLLRIPEGYEIHSMAPDTKADPAPIIEPAPAAAAQDDVATPAVTPEPAPAPAMAPDNVSDLTALTDDELKVVFQQETGRAPHARAKRETIIASIEALREETKGKA